MGEQTVIDFKEYEQWLADTIRLLKNSLRHHDWDQVANVMSRIRAVEGESSAQTILFNNMNYLMQQEKWLLHPDNSDNT